MASFFEPDNFLLDPTSYDESPSSFLSFSSFSDLASTTHSPFDFASWDGLTSHFRKQREFDLPAKPHSDASTSDTSSPRDPFAIVEAAFEPKGPVGIFVGPTPKSLADGNPSSSHSYRSSSSSTETWEDPVTPALSNRSSVESFVSTSTINPGAYKTPGSSYSWDEASIGLGTASRFVQQPHRTTSNPSLNRNQPRVPRTVASMPSLREEEAPTPSAWFDGTEQVDTAGMSTSIGTASIQPEASSLQVTTELVEDFDWAFGDYGLGVTEIPTESNIFYPPEPSSTSTDNQEFDPYVAQPQLDQPWLPTPAAPDASEFSVYDYTAISNLPNFTVDPMSIMAPPLNFEDEPSRPSSAPGIGKDGPSHLLSVPLADAMTRSVSSDGLSFARQGVSRDLFSYAPQQIPVGPPAPQPLYTTEPSPSFTHYARTMPMATSHGRRASAQGLSVQIQPAQYSTYSQSGLPPTPQSAPFGQLSSQQPQTQAVSMSRAGTQPLPTTRRLSGAEQSSGNAKVPAHLARAQVIVQLQEAKEEAQRQEMRRLSASRRGMMPQASVMQPQYQQPQQSYTHPPQYQAIHPPPQRQAIMGWEGPSAQTGTLPVLTTTPLVNVHPPPGSYVGPGGLYTPHKVHPPPPPGTSGRPTNKLPISPVRQRKVSTTPKRSPAVKKRQQQAAGGGGFSWGETTFINFTSDDAEKLLTGVAPSGSQGKRKRDENAIEAEDGVEMAREGSKRSRSGE